MTCFKIIWNPIEIKIYYKTSISLPEHFPEMFQQAY